MCIYNYVSADISVLYRSGSLSGTAWPKPGLWRLHFRDLGLGTSGPGPPTKEGPNPPKRDPKDMILHTFGVLTEGALASFDWKDVTSNPVIIGLMETLRIGRNPINLS